MGSGFRTFQSGEVLTSSNVQNFLMDQSVMVFAGTAARSSAIASPETGMLSYRTDGTADSKRQGFEFYDGSSWVRMIPRSGAIQIVNSQTGAVATGTTTIPFDDTIPQNTEGTEFLSVAITPSSASNLLLIQVVMNYSYSIVNTVTMALFQDSTANALAASSEYGSTATGMINSGLTYYMTAGTTSATTFKVRAGGETAGTLTLNGFGAARKLGGVMISSISVTEFAV